LAVAFRAGDHIKIPEGIAAVEAAEKRRMAVVAVVLAMAIYQGMAGSEMPLAFSCA
jgi:hypothetical protein